MKPIILEFCDTKIKLNINYQNYFRYLNFYFQNLILKDDNIKDIDIDVDIIWDNFNWAQSWQEVKKTGSFKTIGANTLLDKNRLVTFRKFAKRNKIFLDLTRLENESFKATISLRRQPLKDFFRYKLGRKSQESLFFELTYPLLYYPLFWYLEANQNIHPIHAGAVEVDGKWVVICGLEGIGKTSLALQLWNESNQILSDNLIFYNSDNFFPCYELLRLSKNDNILKWNNKIKKVNEFKATKNFYQINHNLIAKSAKPNLVIFPQFSSNYKIKELSPSEATKRALILNQLPAELDNYNEYANLYNLLYLKSDVFTDRYDALYQLLKNTKIYEVNMVKADGLERNASRVKDLIKSS
jgi:hypothetical protein